jgi:vacuolar-type H+-ATPase subunit C/Vma6
MANITLINITTSLMNDTNASLVNETSKLAFLHYLGDPIFLSFALPLLLVIAIAVFVIKNVVPVGPFLYSNARMQARTNFMVTDALLSSLTEAKSLKEFRSILKDTTYAEELEKTKEDLRPFHIALEKGFIESILELVELSPDKSKKLFNAYIMFYEAKILKIIYRAKLMGAEIDEALVYEIGNVDDVLLKHLVETETVADMAVVMVPTIYAKIFEKKYESLEEFETAIDQFVLNNFVEVINKTKMYDGKYIIDMLNRKIDIINILAILKFRVRGIDKDKQKTLLISNNTKVSSKFDLLIDAKELKDFVEVSKGLLYYEPLKKALEKYEKDNALSHFGNELYRFFKKYVIENDLSHTLGPYPLFSYLIKRELELRNLFIISRGIDAGFSLEKIREMVV